MSNTEFTVDRDNLEVRIAKVFNAPPERLWRAHTDPEEIKKWWSGINVDKFEFKVGGTWRFVSSQPSSPHNFRGEFKEIDEPNKIVRTFEYEPMPGHIMTETVIFERLPDNKTKQITVSKYSNQSDLNGMVDSGMEKGAAVGLERLAKLVESN